MKLRPSDILIFLLSTSLLAVGCKGSNNASDASNTPKDTDTGEEPDSDDVLTPDELATPPGGQNVEDVPQFVSIGFDDNGFTDSVGWILDYLKDKKNHDDSPVRVNFFMATGYLHKDDINSQYAVPNPGEDLNLLRDLWKRAYTEGHGIGNHTQHHFHGYDQWDSSFTPKDIFTVAKWEDEITRAHNVLADTEYGPGIEKLEVVGFRTPFLGYHDNLFKALENLNFAYDCSIEDGWQEDQNGTNFTWPYNMINGSEGDKVIVDFGFESKAPRDTIGSHPTLWEMPVSPVIIPPDYRAQEYDFTPGLRKRCHDEVKYFDMKQGKATGLDYNLLEKSGDTYNLNKDEYLATLKYTLDLRLKGNKAPFLFGAHTDFYSEKNPDFTPPGTTWQERREVIEKFIEYALSKPSVKIVTFEDILKYVKDHTPSDNLDSGTDSGTDSGADSGSK